MLPVALITVSVLLSSWLLEPTRFQTMGLAKTLEDDRLKTSTAVAKFSKFFICFICSL